MPRAHGMPDKKVLVGFRLGLSSNHAIHPLPHGPRNFHQGAPARELQPHGLRLDAGDHGYSAAGCAD